MRKGFILICVFLTVLLAVPALAQSTGVDVDGKTYVITGGDGTYEVDGMIFVINENEVIVRREGQEDLQLALEATEEAVVVENKAATESVTVFSVSDDVTAAQGSMTYYTVTEDADSAMRVEVTASDEGEVYKSFTYVYEEDGRAEYSQYAKYGLSYDGAENILYYQGSRVRILEDSWKLGGDAESQLAYFDDEGKVDVRALRDEKGALTGLEALSDAEFAARDLTAWTKTEAARMEATTAMEGELTPEELAAMYEAYEAVGLRYDAERDLMFYGDRQVHILKDIRKSNGEEPGSGKFAGELTQLVYDDGEVDVTIIRDYEHPNAEGDGGIIGVNVVEAE